MFVRHTHDRTHKRVEKCLFGAFFNGKQPHTTFIIIITRVVRGWPYSLAKSFFGRQRLGTAKLQLRKLMFMDTRKCNITDTRIINVWFRPDVVRQCVDNTCIQICLQTFRLNTGRIRIVYESCADLETIGNIAEKEKTTERKDIVFMRKSSDRTRPLNVLTGIRETRKSWFIEFRAKIL